jgi:hypothetical protein
MSKANPISKIFGVANEMLYQKQVVSGFAIVWK